MLFWLKWSATAAGMMLQNVWGKHGHLVIYIPRVSGEYHLSLFTRRQLDIVASFLSKMRSLLLSTVLDSLPTHQILSTRKMMK